MVRTSAASSSCNALGVTTVETLVGLVRGGGQRSSALLAVTHRPLLKHQNWALTHTRVLHNDLPSSLCMLFCPLSLCVFSFSLSQL